MTDYHQAANSVIDAWLVGGVPAVEDWLRREFGVAELRGRAAFITAHADTLADLTSQVRRVVPDLNPIDVGD